MERGPICRNSTVSFDSDLGIGHTVVWSAPSWFFCYCCCSVTKSYPTLCDPLDYSTPYSSVLHYLPEFAQIHVQKKKKKDVLFIIGDCNAKVISQEIPRITGKFGLGVQNEAGQRLRELCQENTLVITNTLFQQHKRWLYTWISPSSQYRNQIDYILCCWRRSSIQSAKIRLRADHELLIAKFRLKLKKNRENH